MKLIRITLGDQDVLVTTRLANILDYEKVKSLAELAAFIRTGKMRYVKNLGRKTEIEARRLCGMHTEKITVCQFCNDSHVCVPRLKSVPGQKESDS